jgi:hypothetical protein
MCNKYDKRKDQKTRISVIMLERNAGKHQKTNAVIDGGGKRGEEEAEEERGGKRGGRRIKERIAREKRQEKIRGIKRRTDTIIAQQKRRTRKVLKHENELGLGPTCRISARTVCFIAQGCALLPVRPVRRSFVPSFLSSLTLTQWWKLIPSSCYLPRNLHQMVCSASFILCSPRAVIEEHYVIRLLPAIFCVILCT